MIDPATRSSTVQAELVARYPWPFRLVAVTALLAFPILSVGAASLGSDTTWLGQALIAMGLVIWLCGSIQTLTFRTTFDESGITQRTIWGNENRKLYGEIVKITYAPKQRVSIYFQPILNAPIMPGSQAMIELVRRELSASLSTFDVPCVTIDCRRLLDFIEGRTSLKVVNLN